MLSIKNVKLNNGNILLTNNEVEFTSGMINIIYGKNNSGKTCLCDAITAESRVNEINFNDRPISSADYIYVSSKHNNFFEMSGFTFLFKYGGKQNLDFVRRNIESFDLPIHCPIELYSSSMKKIVQLLHSLTFNKAVYIYDDLFVNLDTDRQNLVIEILRKIANKRIVLITTSNSELIQFLNVNIFCMEQNQIKKVSPDKIWAYN